MEFNTLAIFTDCVHYFDSDKNIVTENHIFRRQMQALAGLFKYTVIYCPFADYSKDKVTSIYKNSSIQFNPLPNVGGNTVKHKLKILFTMPAWFKAFKKAEKQADIIYQRFPNNLNIPGFFYFYFKRSKVFATYTGAWQNYPGEPSTYRFQKWLLKSFFRGPVMAYTNEEKTGRNIFKTFSPSYTASEWDEEIERVKQRIFELKSGSISEPVFITVGALVAGKNQQYILDTFKILHDDGFVFKLYIVGDGPLRETYSNFILQKGLQQKVFLTGKKKHTELRELYRESHFIIQASLAEGFGKVPLEGFFHGVIPLLNNTGMAAEMTGNTERGFLFSVNESSSLLNLIMKMSVYNDALPELIRNGRVYAKSKTIENWVISLNKKLNDSFE